MKTVLIVVVILLGLGITVYFFMNQKPNVDLSSSTSPSVSPTPSGSVFPIATPIEKLSAQIVKEGTGNGAKVGDSLSVLYTGRLIDGTIFDASSAHGNTPFTLKLGAGSVIKGWDLGLIGAKKGEVRMLFIPPDLGYGETGYPSSPIGPNASLIFEVQVVDIKTN